MSLPARVRKLILPPRIQFSNRPLLMLHFLREELVVLLFPRVPQRRDRSPGLAVLKPEEGESGEEDDDQGDCDADADFGACA